MRRYPEATPCPAPHAPHLSFPSNHYNDYGRQSNAYAPSYSMDDNTTANLDYTTELKVQSTLRNAKPRRPMRGARKPAAFNPSLDIFEDVAQEEEQQQQHEVEIKRKSRTSIMSKGVAPSRSAILAHPAQKIPVSALAVQEPLLHKPHRRRVSQMPAERHAPEVNATVQLQEDILEKREQKRPGPKKDPRRRTMFVPSDDTTMITIHPGQPTHRSRSIREHSPDLGMDLVCLSETEDSLVSALKKEKRVPRKTTVPPKRGALQHSTRPLQSASFSSDVCGKGGGKENVPPGVRTVREKSSGTNIVLNFAKNETKKPAPKLPRVHFNTSKVESVSSTRSTRPKGDGTQKRLRPQQSHEGSPAKSIKAKADSTASRARSSTLQETIKTMKTRMAKEHCLLSSSPFHTDRSPPDALRRRKAAPAPATISMMHIVGKPQQQQQQEKYPVLTEDLARPELYEDNWLTYQEVAITQLLNSMFDSAGRDPNSELSPEELRKKMLAIYHEPSMPILHKRLQASLLCGALSIPKDLLASTLRLRDDVGLRKKYLNLWVKTYDLTSLRAAAETIVGRKISAPCRLSSGSTSSDDGSRQFRSERRAIEAFLDAFLIRNEDAVRVKTGSGSIAAITRGEHDDFGSQAWSWRRTTLRSLMLILLLDKAKTQDILPGCLFQTSSPHKTSTEVLHFLSNILIPSLGDITRPLGHLSYKVEQAQYPLQEYTYHIDNIAIDLRDGVHLTRLVELMIYPPSTLVAQREETVTITMPGGDILTSTFDFDQKESWVLSQHLKFPSIGRAQKLYNVQIALAALTGVRGLPAQAVQGIKAEDIVDGHREKTLSLLWSLVGKCGLASLVDWRQIVKEIELFRDQWYRSRDGYAGRDLDSDNDEETSELEGSEYHKRLLLSWARSIARLQGLRVSNLTTSFSDPKVLETIVDTYLPSAMLNSSATGTKLTLSMKLKATGCSTSFIQLFTPQSAKSIPSKDFTLLTLSFLASRLLPLSRSHRAASILQRAYRLRLSRIQLSRRVQLMKLAADCAVVVNKRNKLLGAATLVQRRWKRILETRREKLNRDVMAFQALARGWAIRRWVRRVTAGRVGGKEKVRRVRGGW